MRRTVLIIIAVVIGAFILIQFLGPKRTNPPVETEAPLPADVKTVMQESCFDCHSNETVWPWYSRVAPVSWLVINDVNEARAEFNLSTWNQWDAEKQAEFPTEAWEEASEGAMPPANYLRMHGNAKLTDEDLAVLRAWAEANPESGESGESESQEAEEAGS